MKIANAYVNIASPGRNFVTLKIETDAVFPHRYSFRDGMMVPGDAPGLGVDLDETLAAKYPYQRAYLPINRKLDGTLSDW